MQTALAVTQLNKIVPQGFTGMQASLFEDEEGEP